MANPRFGRRTWVKLWVNDWLEGTTRYQMSDAQRAFWIDLLAMAGRSRFGGVVCAGRDGEDWIGYPLAKFQGLLAEPIDIEATFELFERTDKITMLITGEGTRRLYTIFISKWVHYQSEYERKKEKRNNVRTNVRQMSVAMSVKSTATEGEVDTEVEGEEKKRRPAAAAFLALGCEPFGSEEFREIWTSAFEGHEGGSASDTMERAISACNKRGIKVPPRFFAIKRQVEKVDAENSFRRPAPK